ncbi:hypothetical protein KORDIASMS9_04621 [Kordia sp. SMS9]|uniref:hypothetical protein n=1 Tax=Kordia sp. SMS9 TaxID=2282170 RepID=UPI000E0CC16E|nr:hypothetical protein [Kordia sp. SMS9]AXG72350.1 hypothetical protein KORDIASMS9_04621 [Kordia sp. SMS9]
MQFLYFDAGLGAMIAQAAVAVAAGVLLFYKSIKYKIRTILGLQKDTSEEVFDDIDVNDETLKKSSQDDN